MANVNDRQERREERRRERDERHREREQRRYERRTGRRPGGGFTIGLILIAIGAIFLVANLVPGFGFGKLWPIIIVALGVAAIVSGLISLRIDEVLNGVLVGTVGVILLYNTLGYVSFSFWINALSLWPVVLISIGLSILGGALGSRAISLLAPLAIIATLILAFLYHGILFEDTRGTTVTSSHEAVRAIKTATARFNLPVGRLGIGATDKLYDFEGKESGGKKPKISFDASGNRGTLAIEGAAGAPAVLGSLRPRWRTFLSRDVTWRIDVENGVTETDFDLSDLKVEHLDVREGIRDIRVRFGDRLRRASARIRGGISNVNLVIPKTVGVRLVVNRGLTTQTFKNASLTRIGESGGAITFETAGFSHAKKQLELDLSAGISNLTVEGY